VALIYKNARSHGSSIGRHLPRDRRFCCVDKVSESTFDSPRARCYSLTFHSCQLKAVTITMDAEHFTSPAPDFPKKRCG
jgi:hypothetical protein